MLGKTFNLVTCKTNINLSKKTEGKYKVTVFTGDKRASGTDANVFVQMYGSLGNTENIKLDNKENNFERGKYVIQFEIESIFVGTKILNTKFNFRKDEFIIGCLCVGEIKKIRIGHDNKGANPGNVTYSFKNMSESF